MQSQRKNPAFAMPSTMIIIPAMKRIVSQLIPEEASPASPAVYQNPGVKIVWTFRVRMTASRLCMPTPKTNIRESRAHPRVTICRSSTSVMMRTNMARKIRIAKICAVILKPSFVQKTKLPCGSDP